MRTISLMNNANTNRWAKRILVGDRVEVGKGGDRDTGIVRAVDGDTATVAWDSGVVTPCPVASLSRTTEAHSGGHRVD